MEKEKDGKQSAPERNAMGGCDGGCDRGEVTGVCRVNSLCIP